jgi:hypothetical protein
VEKGSKFLEIHSSTSDKKQYQQALEPEITTAWWLGFGSFEGKGSLAAVTRVIC